MYTVDDHIKKAPPTVKDVLLKTWAQDTGGMAGMMIFPSLSAEGTLYWYKSAPDKWTSTPNQQEAIKNQIAYLNSAAEVGK